MLPTSNIELEMFMLMMPSVAFWAKPCSILVLFDTSVPAEHDVSCARNELHLPLTVVNSNSSFKIQINCHLLVKPSNRFILFSTFDPGICVLSEFLQLPHYNLGVSQKSRMETQKAVIFSVLFILCIIKMWKTFWHKGADKCFLNDALFKNI
jgi:hypothetical protein